MDTTVDHFTPLALRVRGNNSECFEGPVSKKARMLSCADLRKWSGAATYETKFNRTWIKEIPLVESVHDDPYRKVYINKFYRSWFYMLLGPVFVYYNNILDQNLHVTVV